MMITYALTVIIAVTWIIKMIREQEIKIAKTPLDIPIWLFVVSQLVSTLFSMDPHVSWLGYYSRFNGGMWSVFTYVILYYAFITNFGIFPDRSPGTQELKITKKELRKKQKKQQPDVATPLTPNPLVVILNIVLSTATIVSIYAVLERLGIDKKIWVQDVQDRVFSTLGQPNWLAAYVVALAPVAMALGVSKIEHGKIKFSSIVYFLLSILFFVVLLFTRSRSGLLGFAIADILFWVGLFIASREKRSLLPTIAIVHFVFALIVFFNGSNIAQIDKFTYSSLRDRFTHTEVKPAPKPTVATGPALDTGGTESGTIRKYVWEAAITAWRSSEKTWLIGTGTETFAFAFYQYRPAAHNMTSEWDFLYNKAHNEYLNYLATTGIFGLGTYILFLGVFILWFFKKNQNPMSIALFSGWISILITNFFGFSVVIMQIFLFLFPAMTFILSMPQKSWQKKLENLNQIIGIAVTGILGVIVLGTLVIWWYADTLYAKSYQIARSGQYGTAKTLIDEAIVLNPNEPVYRDERSTTLAALAVGALEQQQATTGGQLAQESLTENNRALQISPQNVNFWKTRTKIYYSFSVYDPKFTQAALEALTHAQTLSPNDPKIFYNLAILYGRTGDNDKAIADLQKSIQLKPDYHDSYYALYVFYTELKQPSDAKGILEKYLTTVDASDKQFKDLLGKNTQ